MHSVFVKVWGSLGGDTHHLTSSECKIHASKYNTRTTPNMRITSTRATYPKSNTMLFSPRQILLNTVVYWRIDAVAACTRTLQRIASRYSSSGYSDLEAERHTNRGSDYPQLTMRLFAQWHCHSAFPRCAISIVEKPSRRLTTALNNHTLASKPNGCRSTIIVWRATREAAKTSESVMWWTNAGRVGYTREGKTYYPPPQYEMTGDITAVYSVRRSLI